MADEGLVVIGAVLLIVGIILTFTVFLCFAGIPLAIVGFILLLVGAVKEQPRPVMYYPATYPVYPPYPLVQSGQPPPTMAPGSMGPLPSPHCPRCGRPTYVPEYARWYCSAENVYPWG